MERFDEFCLEHNQQRGVVRECRTNRDMEHGIQGELFQSRLMKHVSFGLGKFFFEEARDFIVTTRWTKQINKVVM